MWNISIEACQNQAFLFPNGDTESTSTSTSIFQMSNHLSSAVLILYNFKNPYFRIF